MSLYPNGTPIPPNGDPPLWHDFLVLTVLAALIALVFWIC